MSAGTAAEIRSIYRHLIRTSAHAVRHEKAEYQNIRRLLREDVRHLVDVGSSFKEIRKRAAMTYLLHLSSSQSAALAMQRSRMKAVEREEERYAIKAPGGPVHRLMLNMSSLSYHHLSPHTMLQPSTKKTRVGGSDSRSQRRHRQRVIDIQRHATGDDETSSGLKMVTSLLPSLIVNPSRPRGPLLGPSFARHRIPQRWNGQRAPTPSSGVSRVALHAKQRELDELAKPMLRARELSQASTASKEDIRRYEEIYSKFKQERGLLKSMTKSIAQADERITLQLNSANMLSNLVRQVEDSTGAMIGAKRFRRWADDEWLEPN